MTTSGKQQHPIADIDLSGKGDVILSYLARGSALLEFAAATSGKYTVFNRQTRRVVAEFHKPNQRFKHIALPAGQYQLYKQQKKSYLTRAVDLDWGGRHAVDETTMEKNSLLCVCQ